MSVDRLVEAAREAAALGIPAIATFPNIEMEKRDITGSNILERENLINQANRGREEGRAGNRRHITDVALDPFTAMAMTEPARLHHRQ